MNNWLKFKQKLNAGGLLHSIFKQNCLLCAAASGNLSLCNDCITSLTLAPNPSCPQCGLASQGEPCGRCLKQPPYYDATHALFVYAYPLDAILQHYKYNDALYLGQLFGKLLSEKQKETNIDSMVAMPLHADRIKTRGFNQSLEVAKVIAKQLNIMLDQSSCTRIKNTPPQASLPLKERLNNMKGAFQISDSTHIKDKRIVIIDDVMTTGSSLNELAKTLKKAGAKHVECWVIARAVPINH